MGVVWGWGVCLLPEMRCVITGALEPTVTDPVATSQRWLGFSHRTKACARGFLEGRKLWPQNLGNR